MEAEVNSEAGKLIGFILDSGSMQLQAYVSYTNILSLSKRDRRDEVGRPRIRINKLGGTVHYAIVNNAGRKEACAGIPRIIYRLIAGHL